MCTGLLLLKVPGSLLGASLFSSQNELGPKNTVWLPPSQDEAPPKVHAALGLASWVIWLREQPHLAPTLFSGPQVTLVPHGISASLRKGLGLAAGGNVPAMHPSLGPRTLPEGFWGSSKNYPWQGYSYQPEQKQASGLSTSRYLTH